MSFAPANEGIAKLKPYQPGKPISELERELGMTDIVKLASNENPLGCSDKVKEAVAAELAEIGRYPDGGGFILKDQIHAQFGVAHDCITLGNGSNDLLEIFARAFVSEKDSVVYSQHAFAVYALVTQAINAEAIEVPAQGFSHDLDAMAAAIKDNTKLVFIANPNNPTGTWFEEAEFERFMQKVPNHVIVVLDEAYVEYFPENFNSLKFLAQYPNLIVSRTMSKCFGLAALRVGFALASAEVTDFLNRIRQPFNVNHLAMVAAVAALKDEDFIEKSRVVNKVGMVLLILKVRLAKSFMAKSVKLLSPLTKVSMIPPCMTSMPYSFLAVFRQINCAKMNAISYLSGTLQTRKNLFYAVLMHPKF